MLWIKIFHIFFVIAWFSGIFYLPRIFVNLSIVFFEKEVTCENSVMEYERLLLMAKKLYRFSFPLMVLSVGLGIWLWLGYNIGLSSKINWMNLKILLVLLIVIYQFYCGTILRNFENYKCNKGHVWYRVFNEIPVFLLLFIIILVILKPI